jgi:hypothetical protein
MKAMPLADIATTRADRFGLAAFTLGSSQRRHLSARFRFAKGQDDPASIDADL